MLTNELFNRDLLCGERKDYSVCCETATLGEGPGAAEEGKDSGSSCESKDSCFAVDEPSFKTMVVIKF